MRWKLIVAGLIVVAIIAFVVFIAGSVGNSSIGSASNSTGSGSPEKESAQEETAEAVAPDSVTGVDSALYLMPGWLIGIAIIFLIAIIALLFVRWRRPPYRE
ncbi:MAG: hypothetical protein ACXV5H_08505 [Halobacteriota archaeon]